MLVRQLWTNRRIHAVTRLSLLKEDIRSRMGRSIVRVNIDTSGAISLSSSGTGFSVSSKVDGHSFGGVHSQPGPFHHEGCWANSDGNNPLEAQSAGLSFLLMCRQQVGGASLRISNTRLPTNVLKRRGLPHNQLSTMLLSDQAYTCLLGMSGILAMWLQSLLHTTLTSAWRGA